jgi:polysaccharide export outer membrane protein
MRTLAAIGLMAWWACAAGQATETPQPAPAPPNSAVSADYVIGPSDVLNVFVWRNPELSVTVPVRPDGRVSTPLVEDMIAVGKTPSQLARDIEKVLAEFIRSPQVNVIVTTAAAVNAQVKAVGQVRTPQGVPFHAGMHVLDLLLATGGLTDYAAGNRAHIVRTQNGKPTEIKVKLANLVNKGDMTQNIQLEAGDILIVPESRF